MVNILTGTPFEAVPRLHHRADEVALEGDSSGTSRRALLAARGAMFGSSGGGGWTNPYITDGLVAMWDGEWNAGRGGVHDATATTWNDLVGNRHFTMTNPVWGENRLLFRNGNSYGTLSNSDSTVFNIMPATITAVIKPYNSWASSGIYLKASSDSVVAIGFFSSNASFSNNNDYTAFSFPTKNTESVTAVYSNYVNSSVFYGSTVPYRATTNSVGQRQDCVSVGKRLSGSTYYANGYLYNLRLYDRVLTEEEIAYNYAVDADRFGIAN